MRKFLFFKVFVLFAVAVSAQSYNTALVLRVGTDWGFTVQQRIADKLTVEGIVQSAIGRKEVLLTGLLEQHQPLISKRFNIYYGAGIHKGWNNEFEPETGVDYDDPFGVTGVLGAEVTLGKINLSYDFKPAVNLSGGERSVYTQSGVSLRYVIDKRPNKFLGKTEKERERAKRKRQKAKTKRKKQKQKDKAQRGRPAWKFWE